MGAGELLGAIPASLGHPLALLDSLGQSLDVTSAFQPRGGGPPWWLPRFDPLLRGALLVGLFAPLLLGAGRRLLLLPLLAGLGVWLGLGLCGIGPDSDVLPRTWPWDPRRLAAVPWCAAAGAVLLADRRWTAPAVAVAAVLGTGLTAAALVDAPGRPEPFDPGAYVLCPGPDPEHRSNACFDHLRGREVAALEAFVRSEAGPDAGDAVRGWAAVEAGTCEVIEVQRRPGPAFLRGVAAARRACRAQGGPP